MVDIAKLQKKRNTLLLAPKRKLTSVVKPTTVDTTPVAPAPYVPSSSINTSAGSGASVILPTTTTASTTSAPKTDSITDALTKAALVGGGAYVAKKVADSLTNKTVDTLTKKAVEALTSPTKKPAAPATKPAAPATKPPTSVVIPPALQKEQDAQVKAAIAAKNAADHNALVNSFDQGTSVGLPYNTIPNNTPAQAGDVDDSMFEFDQGTDVGLDYNTIPNYTPPSAGEVDDSMFEFDQGTDVGLDYNTIPNYTPPEAGTIDESMFDFDYEDVEDEYVQDELGNIYKMIDDEPVLIRLAEVDEDISEEDYDLFGTSPNYTDQGTELGLDYNTIPDNTPAEAGTIDESMFDDPMGDAEPTLVQDEAGNFFLANEDGSYTPADAYGNPYEEPPPYIEPDLSYLDDFTYEEPDYGYTYDYDPSYYEEPPQYIEPDLSYLDDFVYEDPNYGYDFDFDLGYYDELPAYYESDLSYLDDYKRGGQVQKMKKGGLPHFYTGGGAYDSMDTATYSDVGYEAETSPVDMGGNYAGTDYENMIPTATASNPASIADMEYLYSEDTPNNDNSSYYPLNNDSSGYYPNQTSNMEESVFNPFDLSANEVLMEDEEGRKFAVDQNTGDYRLIEDSKFPTNSDPRSPNTTPTPKTTSTGSGFNYKDLFSTENIKALAGAGLGVAGLMTLYNSMKEEESPYKTATYTPPNIPARTTNFGMGPARTVTPQMGGLQSMTPSQQEELYTNLGVAGYEREHEEPVEDQPMADGGYAQPQQPQSTAPSYFTYGMPQDPLEVLGIKQPQQKSDGGGLQMRQGGLPHLTADVPIVQGRQDYRQGAAVNGEGDGQSDDIPAMLADGEYVIDSDVVAALGNGSNKAGAEVLDKFREAIRTHKRSAPIGKIPPKAKSPLAYLKEAT